MMVYLFLTFKLRSITQSQGGQNVLHTIRKKMANWIGHILHRNCLIKHVIEGQIEGRIQVGGRRCKQLLVDFKEPREYWN